MAEQTIKLGLIQQKCLENPEENIFRTIEKITNAAGDGVQIILLQELFNTLYFPQTVDDQYFDWARPVSDDLTHQLCDLARELEIVIVAPFFEHRTAGIYHNSLMVIDADGTLMGIYRKKHIPDDPGFYEKYYFTPGEDDYQVFDTKYAKIGPLICWDQWFPEVARIMALKGAEILLYPSAIGTLPDENKETGRKFLDAWQTVQRSHAIANGCFVASVNRAGREDKIEFWGHSFVAGPFGQMLAQAGVKEEVLITEIDLAMIEKQRREWPFFRDRRIDTYEPILKRFIDS